MPKSGLFKKICKNCQVLKHPCASGGWRLRSQTPVKLPTSTAKNLFSFAQFMLQKNVNLDEQKFCLL